MSTGIEIFTPLANDYARYRPGYPAEVLSALETTCGLTPDWVVADIGSGTGKLADLFLAAGHRVIGVEPNREMRLEGERLLAGHSNFHSLDGTAESIPIEANSVDLVAVGQALHWFDVDKARTEFRRVLRPGGWIAVLWNDPVPDTTGFTDEYRSACRAWSEARQTSDPAPSLNTGVDRIFGGAVPHHESFPHVKRFDLEGFLGRVRSSGKLPQPGNPGHDELTALLTDVFNRYQREGAVELHYVAQLYVDRLDVV